MLQSTHLSGEEQDQLRRIFQKELTSAGGRVTVKGLSNMLEESGFRLEFWQVQKAFDEIDSDCDGTIFESEFLKHMQRMKASNSEEEELERAFANVSDERGMARECFVRFVRQMCPMLKQEQAQFLSMEVDADQDGFINKSQFMYIFLEYGMKDCSGTRNLKESRG